jgi:hypothetical protein
VVAIAIAASGTPTKVSSNMRVSVKKNKKIKIYINCGEVVELSLLNTVQLCFCFSCMLYSKKMTDFFSQFTKFGGY